MKNNEWFYISQWRRNRILQEKKIEKKKTEKKNE